MNIPHITTEQMIEVDRLMIEEFHIELKQMMENAGRNLANLARDRFLEGDPKGKKIIVLVGSGNNGGGALVAARRLHTWGAEVEIYQSRLVEDLGEVAAHQLDIADKIGIPHFMGNELLRRAENPAPALVIDGLIGYHLTGNPYGLTGEMVTWANRQMAPVLSLDTPSGIDLTTGTVYHPVIQAVATLTLALPKTGLFMPGVMQLVGELYLADISVPSELYKQMGIEVGPIFAEHETLRLEPALGVKF